MPSKPAAKGGHKSKTDKTTTRDKTSTAREKHSSKSHHTKSKSKPTTSRAHTTTKTTTSRTATKTTRADVEGGRGLSSSLGPGVADPVLLAILVILGISAIILFIIGVWLLAARTGWPVGLNLSGSKGWTRFISYGTACVILSIIFILVIVFAFLAASTKRGASARINRLLAVFFASLAFLILVLMTFNAIFFASNSPRFIANVIRDGWINTVTDFDSLDACRIQDRYDCEGWEDGSCNNCRPRTDGDYGDCTEAQKRLCPRCFQARRRNLQSPFRSLEGKRRPMAKSGRQQKDKEGCRDPVLRRYRGFFIPMSVYTIFLALILVLLSWKTCIDSSGR